MVTRKSFLKHMFWLGAMIASGHVFAFANCLLGAKGTSTEASNSTEWCPYVTCGLIAMWDGEWNVAPGVHDNYTETWKNLVPSSGFSDAEIEKESDYTRIAPFDDNACRLDGTFFWKFTAPDDFETLFLGDLTLTIVKKLGTPSYKDGTIFFGLGGGKWGKPNPCRGMSQTLKVAIGSAYAQHDNRSISMKIPEQHITVVKSVIDNRALYKFYADGEIFDSYEVATRSTGCTRDGFLFGSSGNTFGGNGRYWTPNPPEDGYAWALRFHKRALTEEEISYNYAVDKERFGL